MPTEELGPDGRQQTIRLLAEQNIEGIKSFQKAHAANYSDGHVGFDVIIRKSMFADSSIGVAVRFVEKGGLNEGWSDITVEVFYHNRLDQARSFATAYEKLSGRKAKLIIQYG
jgi:hypothetical protein